MLKPRFLLAAALLLQIQPAFSQRVALRAGASQSGPGLRFAQNPSEVRSSYARAQARMDRSLRSILAIPAGRRTFANSIRALETATAEFGDEVNQLALLNYLSPDTAVRSAAQAAEVQADEYGIALWTNAELYQAVRDYAAQGEDLQGEDKKLLKGMLDDFESQGMGLPEAKAARLKEVNGKLTELQSKFAQNIQERAGQLELDRSELEGLPDDYVRGLSQTPEGKYVVGLDYPEMEPFMKYARRPELRRRLQYLFQNRAAEKNVPVLEEALRLRHEAAGIMGKANYAEMAIEDRMAKSPERVKSFLERLKNMLSTRGSAEVGAMLEEKRKEEPSAERLESWDIAYYGEKMRRALYDLDSNEVKQYFPIDRVVEGTLKIYQNLLGLVFTEIPAGQTWHSDVRLFEIKDAETGRRIGHFYLDLYPRPGKYTHMAVLGVLNGRELENGGYREPMAVMMGNFSKASGQAPSLLRHDEVETFFHEFGHIMHDTLSRVRYARHARVARDFVEAPSQMLENFVWQPEVLAQLSGHWQDPSRKLPSELLAKMLKAKSFNQAFGYLHQIALATIDLAYHAAIPESTTRLYHQIMAAIRGVPLQEGTNPQASFGHILGGYGAGYYGYLWSEVFAQDIFSIFKNEGVLNPAVGMRYRRAILEKGSARPEADSLRDFLGREPDEKAFLDGLVPAPES